jgi:23S rRNA pseudouridine2605 synthase
VPRPPGRGAGVSLPRALSKLGLCSRTQGERLVAEGRVRVDGRVVRDATARVDLARARISVDDAPVAAERKVYLMLNKPRGLVTTRHDPQGRPTVYECLRDPALPFVSPVGRLDRASEGLLLVTNDTRWAQRLLDPAAHVEKTYHVQIDRLPDDALLARLHAGVTDDGERLAVRAARVLRTGTRHAWLEVVLDEGRNRHIRRLLAALDTGVLRLVRVAIGPLALGDLAKGAVRALTPAERAALAGAGRRPP